jgi:hypothetical protein
MKRTLITPALLPLGLLAGCAQAQRTATTVPDPELAGQWTGYVIDGPGNRVNVVLDLGLADNAYTGTLRVTGDNGPVMELRSIDYADGTLTFEFDFPSPRGAELIHARLQRQDDELSGEYTDPTGDSDRMYFTKS